jgi:type IV pilus assembly protein PilA
MVQKLRERSQGEGGFTLVELLVVMLILGLLAAIAIPSFFNQRDKARDADAKSAARTAQTAVETYATDNEGSYSGADVAALEDIESTLTDRVLEVTLTPGVGVPSDSEYTVTAESDTGNTFSITRNADGTTSLTCETEGEGGCPSAATAGDPGIWG